MGKRKNNPKQKKKVIVEDDTSNTEEYDDSLFSNPEEEGSESEVPNSDEESEIANSDKESEIADSDEENSGDEDLDYEEVAKKHKQSLKNLKNIDPEFYQYLEGNGKKLLEFNLSDDDNEDLSEFNNDTEDVPDVHVPQLDSDESDFEEETVGGKKRNITFKQLKKWQADIKTDKTNKTIGELSQALHSALLLVTPEEGNDELTSYKVEGSAMFNGVVQLCVLEFGPAVKKFLGLEPGAKGKPHLCKKFKKVKKILNGYFEDLLKLLSGVASANIQTVILKHLHYMSSMLISFPNITKDILKQLIKIWGVSEEGVRVIAFFCILKIVRSTHSLLDTALKTMFITYVKNSKFVSPSSLPCINFMRRSLVEIFALDLNIAYQHVFLYIRQLAIHLRNALTVNKKENIQAVYNWQFVNSLQLWGSLLSVTGSKTQMEQLIYPFVQVCLGTLRLVPTAQYYPLRFHVTQILMNLSRDSDVFIPVLPFIVDVLDNYDFNKKSQKVSMKPLQFNFILRLSKSQMLENGFKDTLIDTIYDQLLEYLTIQSNSVAFVELSFFTRIQIKKFLKTCKNPNYVKKMKQALEKIEQNVQFIENERKKITIDLSDCKQIEGHENQIKCKGTPLSTFYESWSKLRNQKKRKNMTQNDELGDYNIPTMKKRKKEENKQKKEHDIVFSDSEDDSEELLRLKVESS